MQIIRRQNTNKSSISLVDNQVLQRVYINRGISHPKELDRTFNALLPFETLSGIDTACARLYQALCNNEKILIIGDFDADGATSTALGLTALKAMGAYNVDFLVPNRFEFGYGLTEGIVEVAKAYEPNLIITVDNGIASFDGVMACNKANIDVLVTDHHLPAETMPDAFAIVNPNKPGDLFASKSIAGVGVIFYLMLAFRRKLENLNWFTEKNIPVPNMASFLDLVALGTVADVVALDQNNRVLVYQGLQRIRRGFVRPGIKALIDVAGKKHETLVEQDLGFAIAPRLNAAGRLDDMSKGISCLIESDYDNALMLAYELNQLNIERKKIESDMQMQAIEALQSLSLDTTSLPLALCLTDDTWHQGVIGILAGRLKEKYHRPVIIFAKVSDSELKGSARSILGVNIRDVLASIDKDNPELINKFGGHAMAAGLSIHPQKFNEFNNAFIKEISTQIDFDQCQGKCFTDGPLQAHEISIDTAKILQFAGPWGQQFPEPLFDNEFIILEKRLVGKNHLKMLLSLQGENLQPPIDAIAFNIDPQILHEEKNLIHAAYSLDINEFKGRINLQLIIRTLKFMD